MSLVHDGVYVVTWGDLKKASAAEVWHLVAASLGRSLKDPRTVRDFIRDAMWASKDVYLGRYYTEQQITDAKYFCERLELASLTLTGGNVFGATSVDDFLGLANAAGWDIPKCFKYVKYVKTRKKNVDSHATPERLFTFDANGLPTRPYKGIPVSGFDKT